MMLPLSFDVLLLEDHDGVIFPIVVAWLSGRAVTSTAFFGGMSIPWACWLLDFGQCLRSFRCLEARCLIRVLMRKRHIPQQLAAAWNLAPGLAALKLHGWPAANRKGAAPPLRPA